MVAAKQRLLAVLTAAIAHRAIVLGGAGRWTALPRAEALLFQFDGAVAALVDVALPLAVVGGAVERLVAGLITAEVVLLAALEGFLHAAAAAGARNERVARRTGAGVAEQSARVLAILLLAAHVATAVRHVVPIELRILQLAAEAEVLGRLCGANVLAGTAAPALVRLGRRGPLDHALQVDDVEAVLARPNRLEGLDFLAADQTLQAPRVDLLDQLVALVHVEELVGAPLLRVTTRRVRCFRLESFHLGIRARSRVLIGALGEKVFSLVSAVVAVVSVAVVSSLLRRLGPFWWLIVIRLFRCSTIPTVFSSLII